MRRNCGPHSADYADLTNECAYNPASQVTSLTQRNVEYNYTEAQNRVGAYGVKRSIDMKNRLVATGGTKSSTLVYDVLGRLAQISMDGATMQFQYDGDALVGEYVVGTGQTRRYVHSGGADEPLVQYDVVSGVTKR
jgi:hypothetical protein